MSLKVVAGWVVVLFPIWWCIAQPTGAEHVVLNIGHFLTTAVHGISSLFAKA